MFKKHTKKDTTHLNFHRSIISKSIMTISILAFLQACGGSGDSTSSSEQASHNTDIQTTSNTQMQLGMEDVLNETPSNTTKINLTSASNKVVAHQSGLSMNLEGFSYYSGDFPTIDVFKRANNMDQELKDGNAQFNWVTTTSIYDWGDEAHNTILSMDENGWIKELPAIDENNKPRFARAFMFHNDGNAHPIGWYTVVYEGEGDIEYSGMKGSPKILPDQGDGKHRVQVEIGQNTSFSIIIKKTLPSNYIRNIQVIAPGGVCSSDKLTVVESENKCGGNLGKFISMETLSKTQLWYPTFLKDLTGIRTLRFMDWGVTNTNTVSTWSERAKWNNAFWTSNKGVPIGAMINLSNTLNADAWINIPYQADDDYVRNAARLIKRNLNPNLKLILEYSNEPWNGKFAILGYAKEQGAKIFVDEKGNLLGDDWQRGIQWSSMRSAQVCQIVKTEFGSEANRVNCTVNAWASNVWTTDNEVLPCSFAVTTKQLPQACGKYFDSVAIAPYFGNYIGENSDSRHFMLTEWFSRGDTYALGELFKEIRAKDDAGNDLKETPFVQGAVDGAPKKGALNQAKDWTMNYTNSTVIRQTYGLPIISYEAGQHLVVPPNDCAKKDKVCQDEYQQFKPKWISLYKQANQDPRMGESYKTYMTNWTSADTQFISMFANTGAYGNYGAWGLRENYLQSENLTPKWNAVAPYRTTPCWWGNCQQ